MNLSNKPIDWNKNWNKEVTRDLEKQLEFEESKSEEVEFLVSDINYNDSLNMQ